MTFKGKIIRSMPETVFATVYGKAHFRHLDRTWKITKQGISLLSPTSKFIGFGLDDFKDKFERFFKIGEGDTCLNVGACIGDTTVPMLMKTGESGFVYAVEPDPKNVEFLTMNLQNFPNSKIIEVALSDFSGSTILHLHSTPTGHSFEDGLDRQGCTRIICKRLDDLLLPKIDFMKVDVQGSEVQVLQGGQRFLRDVKHLVVETHCRNDPQKTYPKVLEILNSLGFETKYWNGLVYAE
jgi:FkbM family methyltransferase